MKTKDQYTPETKLEIFGSLSEFFTVREILEQFPKIQLSESSGYSFLNRNHLPTVKRSYIDRRKLNEIQFKTREEELKLNALADLQESLTRQGIDY